jgi:hypothetical protein
MRRHALLVAAALLARHGAFASEPEEAPGPAASASAPSELPAETQFDERGLGPVDIAPPRPLDEGFCGECVAIGTGVGIVLLGIPFVALSEIARHRKESLDAWVTSQGQNADLGFAPGYGFARADTEQTRFLIAGITTLGLGAATILTTAIVIAVQKPGGRSLASQPAPLSVTPMLAPGGFMLRGSF